MEERSERISTREKRRGGRETKKKKNETNGCKEEGQKVENNLERKTKAFGRVR